MRHTVQGPIPSSDALPFSLALLLQARHVDIQLPPLNVHAGVTEVYLDDPGIRIVADPAVGAQAIEEAEDAAAVQQAGYVLGEESAQLGVVLAERIEVYRIVKLALLQKLRRDLLLMSQLNHINLRFVVL